MKSTSSATFAGKMALGVVAMGVAVAADAPMPVRHSEGVVHGYLVLSTPAGVALAHGELLQNSRNGDVEGRMIFQFKDGSLSDEKTVFTQRDVFTLQSYHQIQRGPAFPQDLDFEFARASGFYHLKTKSHSDGSESVDSGKIDLPADLYNGMVIAISKNIPPGGRATIHMLALAPKPMLIQLEINPTGDQKVVHGELQEIAIHYALHPKLGVMTGTFAKVLGRYPPDEHLWMVVKETPGFVKFEGPLYLKGPVWRIQLAAPCFPSASEPCRG